MTKQKTIAQRWGITDFPLRLYDSNGNMTYYEDSTYHWYRWEFDADRNLTYCEDSDGYTKGTPNRVEFTMEELSEKLGVPLAQLKIKGKNDD